MNKFLQVTVMDAGAEPNLFYKALSLADILYIEDVIDSEVGRGSARMVTVREKLLVQEDYSILCDYLGSEGFVEFSSINTLYPEQKESKLFNVSNFSTIAETSFPDRTIVYAGKESFRLLGSYSEIITQVAGNGLICPFNTSVSTMDKF
jgi:hypothetical protein